MPGAQLPLGARAPRLVKPITVRLITSCVHVCVRLCVFAFVGGFAVDDPRAHAPMQLQFLVI